MDIQTLRNQLDLARVAREAAEEAERYAARELAKATAGAWVMIADHLKTQRIILPLSLECRVTHEGNEFTLLHGIRAFQMRVHGPQPARSSLGEICVIGGLAMVAVGYEPSVGEACAFFQRFGTQEKVDHFMDSGPAVAMWQYPD